MTASRFDDERRRLRAEMEAEIDEIRASYRPRFEAIDRAEELMDFAASGAPAAGQPPSQLRQDLRRLLAGWNGELRIDDARERIPSASPQAIRACLDRMAKAGEVRILRAGGPDQEPVYEPLEPDYGGVLPAEPGG